MGVSEESGKGIRKKKLRSLVGLGRAHGQLGGPKARHLHAQATHFGQAIESPQERPSLSCPSLTSGCQHTVQPALCLSPSPWSHPLYSLTKSSHSPSMWGRAWQTPCILT